MPGAPHPDFRMWVYGSAISRFIHVIRRVSLITLQIGTPERGRQNPSDRIHSTLVNPRIRIFSRNPFIPKPQPPKKPGRAFLQNRYNRNRDKEARPPSQPGLLPFGKAIELPRKPFGINDKAINLVFSMKPQNPRLTPLFSD